MPIIKEDPLHGYSPAGFSFTKVKGEVSQAMQEDWKRDKVDDAKKRAIYDCRNYDDFKARVAGCTLKPIHRNEFNAPPKFAFNRQAGPAAGSKTDATAAALEAANAGRLAAAAAQPAVGSGAPRNSRDFEKELRRRGSAEDRAALVVQLTDDDVARLFGREVDAEVLRQLLVALDEAPAGTAPGAARRFLAALAVRCPISAAVAGSFLTADERGIVARLLAREQAHGPSEDVRICAAFGVPMSSVASALAALAVATDAAGSSAAQVGGGAAAASPHAAPVQLDVAPASAEDLSLAGSLDCNQLD